jgi:ribosomal protein S18 acetylase RimI-like enzyme
MEILRCSVNDLDQLLEISYMTFLETYGADNKPENLQFHLNTVFNKNRLKLELSDPNVHYYFAMFNGLVIGYLKLNFDGAQTELKDDESVEIERIYVLRVHQGKKIGQQLFEKALEIARRSDKTCLWLGVWERNVKAINFYEQNGLRRFGTHIFRLGTDQQSDILMKRELRPNR